MTDTSTDGTAATEPQFCPRGCKNADDCKASIAIPCALSLWDTGDSGRGDQTIMKRQWAGRQHRKATKIHQQALNNAARERGDLAAKTYGVTQKYGRLDDNRRPVRCAAVGSAVIYDTTRYARRALDALIDLGHTELQSWYACELPGDTHYHLSTQPPAKPMSATSTGSRP